MTKMSLKNLSRNKLRFCSSAACIAAAAAGILERIRRRSETGIYNHPSVAEVVGAGFELVMGMLDIFVPCVGEIDREKCGGAPASTRSRRIAAMLPPMLHHPDPGNACRRLMSILDYISGMTDRNAVTLYQKLKGISL